METKMITCDDDTQNPYLNLERQRPFLSDVLDINSFIKETNYDIDPLFVDEQWSIMNVISPFQLIKLSQDMLDRLNFCRTSALIKKLEQLFPSPRGANNEYWGDGVNVSIVFAATIGVAKKGRGGHNSKEIKLTKGAYKELLMETQTDAARKVRKYYICLEELFIQYLLYQRAHQIVKSERQMECMEIENKDLSMKMDLVIAQNNEVIAQNNEVLEQNKIQQQKLDMLAKLMYKESDDKVMDVKSAQKKQELVLLQSKEDPNMCEVLRGQKTHVNYQLKRKQDQMEFVGKIDTYKNPINLYNRFSEITKKQKDERFQVQNNKVTLKNGASPKELFDLFYNLDIEKHEIAQEVKKVL
jgi:hypothetical protein